MSAVEINKDTNIELVKVITAHDEMVAKIKFIQNSVNFNCYATLIIFSNADISSLKAFDDPAFHQWLVKFFVPALKDKYRIEDIEYLLMQHKSDLFRWILSMSEEQLLYFQRVGTLNDEISPERSLFFSMCSGIFFS